MLNDLDAGKLIYSLCLRVQCTQTLVTFNMISTARYTGIEITTQNVQLNKINEQQQQKNVLHKTQHMSLVQFKVYFLFKILEQLQNRSIFPKLIFPIVFFFSLFLLFYL